jgi:hypothetical protein
VELVDQRDPGDLGLLEAPSPAGAYPAEPGSVALDLADLHLASLHPAVVPQSRLADHHAGRVDRASLPQDRSSLAVSQVAAT